MLRKKYFEIFVKDNNLVYVCEIDEERFNYFDYTFDYLYHTKKGDTYKLDKDLNRNIDILIVDGERLYELLDDMKEQGFYDPEGGD